MQEELKALSVLELTKIVKEAISNMPLLQNVLVEGEISNYTLNQSGHIYFTIKDEYAQLSCVMFKAYASYIPFSPKDGDKVYVKGSIEVYEKTGRYQMYVRDIKEKGIGDLYQKFEALKLKLSSLGYFSEDRKKPFPKFPKNIALLTSRTGAVIEDLKSIILSRSQFSNLTLYPMKVQGEDAKYDIVKKIDLANKDDDIDVIILARGGGSIEDLWPFNEEIVAQAIYNSKKPIISAIGHETDFTISDFVADKRCATPSDAALNVVRDKRDLKMELDSLTLRLNRTIKNLIDNYKSRVDKFSNSVYLKDKDKLLTPFNQRILNLSLRLDALNPSSIIKAEKVKLDNLVSNIKNAYSNIINNNKHSYLILNQKLNLLNPLSILDKGYSITYLDNQIIKDASMVKEGDVINTKLKKGTIKSIVIGESKDGKDI